MTGQPLYPIGIVAELIGVRPETLRVWDRQGLVTPNRRRGSRCYSDADLQRVLFVRHLLYEEGLNLAAVRGYVRLYPCWALDDCVPCHAVTTANDRPCWKRPGAYCGLAEEESLVCSTCPERDSRAATLPLTLRHLRDAPDNGGATPAAGRGPIAGEKSGGGRAEGGTRLSAMRSEE